MKRAAAAAALVHPKNDVPYAHTSHQDFIWIKLVWLQFSDYFRVQTSTDGRLTITINYYLIEDGYEWCGEGICIKHLFGTHDSLSGVGGGWWWREKLWIGRLMSLTVQTMHLDGGGISTRTLSSVIYIVCRRGTRGNRILLLRLNYLDSWDGFSWDLICAKYPSPVSVWVCVGTTPSR